MSLIPALLGLALAAAAALLIVVNGGAGPEPQRPADIALAAALASFLIVGALLVRHRPRDRIAWLLVGEGCTWELAIFLNALLNRGAPVQPILDWIWVPAVAGIPLLLLLFPTGRPPTRRWWLVAAALPLLPLAVLGALASLVVRYRRAADDERRQIAWFASAGALIAAGFATAAVLGALGVSETVTSYLNVVPLVALPVAIGIALTEHTVLLGFAAAVYVTSVAIFGGWKAALATLPVLALPLVKRRRRTPLTIHVLGGFHVEPPAQWPSKKARTLLKILVAKRGRPVAREQLMEYLWPGEDARKLGNRLSVALTALRTAIGADAIVTRDGTVALSGVRVDVEEFLARPHKHRFAGELLPEDRYEDWAADLREAYTTALRTKAGETRRDDEAIRIYVHLLEHDPYDRPAHAALVARLDRAGRHGEAISRRRDYIRAMAEIGVQAAL